MNQRFLNRILQSIFRQQGRGLELLTQIYKIILNSHLAFTNYQILLMQIIPAVKFFRLLQKKEFRGRRNQNLLRQHMDRLFLKPSHGNKTGTTKTKSLKARKDKARKMKKYSTSRLSPDRIEPTYPRSPSSQVRRSSLPTDSQMDFDSTSSPFQPGVAAQSLVVNPGTNASQSLVVNPGVAFLSEAWS
jgi:hypothetical protein